MRTMCDTMGKFHTVKTKLTTSAYLPFNRNKVLSGFTIFCQHGGQCSGDLLTMKRRSLGNGFNENETHLTAKMQ